MFSATAGFRGAHLRGKDPRCGRLWGVVERLSHARIRHPVARLQVLKAFFISWVTQGCEVWGPFTEHNTPTPLSVDLTMASVLRAELRLPRSTAFDIVMSETGFPLASWCIFRSGMRFLKRVLAHSHTNRVLHCVLQANKGIHGGWVACLSHRYHMITGAALPLDSLIPPANPIAGSSVGGGVGVAPKLSVFADWWWGPREMEVRQAEPPPPHQESLLTCFPLRHTQTIG